MKLNRRELLRNTALASGAALLGVHLYSGKKIFAPEVPLPSLPSPEDSGIEHIVVVTMENRKVSTIFWDGYRMQMVGRPE